MLPEPKKTKFFFKGEWWQQTDIYLKSPIIRHKNIFIIEQGCLTTAKRLAKTKSNNQAYLKSVAQTLLTDKNV